MTARASAFEQTHAASSADSAPVVAEADSGAGLRSFLLGQYKEGKMAASFVTTVAFHATNAGAEGVRDLSYPLGVLTPMII